MTPYHHWLRPPVSLFGSTNSRTFGVSDGVSSSPQSSLTKFLLRKVQYQAPPKAGGGVIAALRAAAGQGWGSQLHAVQERRDIAVKAHQLE